ncbi:MAG: sn-glycerol-3-phosphate ABC transporter ATP-binding protein UgpC [Pelagimonas sp.]
MASIALNNLVKEFGETRVLHSIDLDIKDGEFVVFVGPSGCGKSTTLRMVAGLESVSSGEIRIGDREVSGLAPKDRGISMVFQDYALYPHMTVRKNLGFGLKVSGTPAAEITQKVDEAAKMLGLEQLLDRKPKQLSGGQRQRVAMGRAIVRSPEVYLFDEPLSNLDAKLRTQMRSEIKRLHKKVRNTIIYVTHDQIEAMTMADRIVVMRGGHIEQVGTPSELFKSPANVFVATFIGSPPMAMVDGEIVTDGASPMFQAVNGPLLPIPARLRDKVKVGQKVFYGIRSDSFSPVGHSLPRAGEVHQMSCTVDHVEPLGAETLISVALGTSTVLSKMFNPSEVDIDETRAFELELDGCYLFDKGTEQSLDL